MYTRNLFHALARSEWTSKEARRAAPHREPLPATYRAWFDVRLRMRMRVRAEGNDRDLRTRFTETVGRDSNCDMARRPSKKCALTRVTRTSRHTTGGLTGAVLTARFILVTVWRLRSIIPFPDHNQVRTASTWTDNGLTPLQSPRNT